LVLRFSFGKAEQFWGKTDRKGLYPHTKSFGCQEVSQFMYGNKYTDRNQDEANRTKDIQDKLHIVG